MTKVETDLNVTIHRRATEAIIIDRITSRDIDDFLSVLPTLLVPCFCVSPDMNQSVRSTLRADPVKVSRDRRGLTNGWGNRMVLKERIFAKACPEVEEVPWETLKSDSPARRANRISHHSSNAID